MSDQTSSATPEQARDDEDFRIEHDTMGEVKVPRSALWRAQTQRAVENFPISGRPIEPAHIHALALIKAAAARANAELGVLDEDVAAAIEHGRHRGRRRQARRPVPRSTSSRPAAARRAT
ncbi:MAG: hypothetical protein WKF73_02255 [Nocardioidaceae bacterium]